MRRMIAAVLLALPALAGRASASAEPEAKAASVRPAAMQAEVDALRDAINDGTIGLEGMHGRAAALFHDVQSRTPVARPASLGLDHEPVDGHLGTVQGMVETAQARLEDYRRTHLEPPPPQLVDAVNAAAALREAKRADFDRSGQLADNQMGVFRYVKDAEGGVVELNRSMALIAARVGEAFTFATFAHEAGHALAHEQGRLDPSHDVDDEVEAFRVQYLWLTLMDPTGWRLVILDTSLHTYLQLHPDSPITAMAIRYMDHLAELRATGGEDKRLKEFVEKLGYSDQPARASTPTATPAAPAPVRA